VKGTKLKEDSTAFFASLNCLAPFEREKQHKELQQVYTQPDIFFKKNKISATPRNTRDCGCEDPNCGVFAISHGKIPRTCDQRFD
jgi:hypothetical protein